MWVIFKYNLIWEFTGRFRSSRGVAVHPVQLTPSLPPGGSVNMHGASVKTEKHTLRHDSLLNLGLHFDFISFFPREGPFTVSRPPAGQHVAFSCHMSSLTCVSFYFLLFPEFTVLRRPAGRLLECAPVWICVWCFFHDYTWVMSLGKESNHVTFLYLGAEGVNMVKLVFTAWLTCGHQVCLVLSYHFYLFLFWFWMRFITFSPLSKASRKVKLYHLREKCNNKKDCPQCWILHF